MSCAGNGVLTRSLLDRQRRRGILLWCRSSYLTRWLRRSIPLRNRCIYNPILTLYPNHPKPDRVLQLTPFSHNQTRKNWLLITKISNRYLSIYLYLPAFYTHRACQVCRTWYEQISVSRPLMATLTNFRGKQQQSQKSKPPPKQSSDENSHKARG